MIRWEKSRSRCARGERLGRLDRSASRSGPRALLAVASSRGRFSEQEDALQARFRVVVAGEDAVLQARKQMASIGFMGQ